MTDRWAGNKRRRGKGHFDWDVKTIKNIIDKIKNKVNCYLTGHYLSYGRFEISPKLCHVFLSVRNL